MSCDMVTPDYDVTPRDGSANKSGSSDHVFRGGSWGGGSLVCRSSHRDGWGNWGGIVGFRVVFSV